MHSTTVEIVGLKNGNYNVISKKLKELNWLSTTLHNVPFIEDAYETIRARVEADI
jgi:ribonuclease HIII